MMNRWIFGTNDGLINTALEEDAYPELRFCGFVGMPRALYLKSFAEHVKNIFETNVYLVGSALETKDWHDLDIVAVLSDEQWSKFDFGEPINRFENKKWIAYCLALSNFGKSIIGCEIDFQIIQKSYDLQTFKDNKKLEL